MCSIRVLNETIGQKPLWISLRLSFGLTLKKVTVAKIGVWVSIGAMIVGVVHSIGVVWVSVYRWCTIGGCITSVSWPLWVSLSLRLGDSNSRDGKQSDLKLRS